MAIVDSACGPGIVRDNPYHSSNRENTPSGHLPMTHRLLLAITPLLVLTSTTDAVEPSELKPGLITTYAESADGRSGRRVSRVEPTVALFLNAGETAHPSLRANGQVTWRGHINIVRAGKYRFSADVRGGSFEVQLDGKAVLPGSGDDSGASDVRAAEISLTGGVKAFVVTFTQTGKTAQVELRWQGPGFREEPLPHQFLGHLPGDRPASFAEDARLEHGRFAFEELACIRCHKPSPGDKMAKTLVDRAGPNLTDVAKRSYAGWIDQWLADPAKLRPHTTMPKLFGDDETGRAERYAVVRYLVSLAGKPLAPHRPPTLDNNYRQSMNRGRVLFTTTGCAACHTEPQPKKPARNDEDERPAIRPEDQIYSAGTPDGPIAKYDLGLLGSKYRPETLAAYLQDPLTVNPAGRMPHMSLNGQEAQDIARYLCREFHESFGPQMPLAEGLNPSLIAAEVFATHGSQPGEYAAFRKRPADTQWLDLGKKLLVAKGCVNCHAVEPGGKALASWGFFPSLDAVKKSGAGTGCLNAKPDPATTPDYHLKALDSSALTAFLKDGLAGAGTPAPAYAARIAIRRFSCLNCHSKDGEGGLDPTLVEQMRTLEKAENADDVLPPLLTGIGHKSRTSWLKSVLTQGGRARSWMQLRMPQYGAANVGRMPEAFAALEGIAPDDSNHKVPLTAMNIATGRQIIGKEGLGCISCHDIAGVPNTGTRGPDLTTINQRVRYEWYERWLHQPLRMAPGTRMPQAFVENKSTLATVFDGDPKKQAEAMWAYLSLGPGLPLPLGMEPPKGLIVAVHDRPEILRTFLSDAGNKAIAVGYPGGVSVAFSADECRLSYAWAGNFLDATPVWNNRGGNPAKLLGPKFWTAPPMHPWGLTANPRIAPDFLKRAGHPAFGTPLPFEPIQIYQGPMAVQFDGYSLNEKNAPTFRYTLREGPNAELKVAETPEPLTTAFAAGLRRRFTIEAPGGFQTWLLAGTTTKQPRSIPLAGGRAQPRDDVSVASHPAAGIRVVLPADGGRATVLEVAGAPRGTEWHFVKSGNQWLAIIRLPQSKTPLKASFALTKWGLPKDDDALLNGLAAK